jgi:hypothetical protein
MRHVEPKHFRELNILKHYRIIRKWACRNNDLREADLELIIYLDCLSYFSKQNFKEGSFSYSWDNRRWNRLLKEGWIVVWRERNYTTQKHHLYQISFKGKQLINRIYRIMLGQEDIPEKERSNSIMRGETYMDKVLRVSIKNMNNDEKR